MRTEEQWKEIELQKKIDTFVEHYSICAIWTNEELDGFTSDDINMKAQLTIIEDCYSFLVKAWGIVSELDLQQAGHDFWLTRNGHGTGFWDREDVYKGKGEELTKLAESYGEQYVYLNGDKVGIE